MAWPIPTERQRRALATPPALPAELRGRVLESHHLGRLRRRRRAAALLAIPLVCLSALLAGAWPGPDPDIGTWRQGVALEARWRAEADFEWLRRDARARLLLDELRSLDEALADGATDTDEARSLWQARHDALARLLASRRDGRTAVFL